VQAADQGGAVGVGAREHVEQLAGRTLAESIDDPGAEVVQDDVSGTGVRPVDLDVHVDIASRLHE
jgi:hypothetical protein